MMRGLPIEAERSRDQRAANEPSQWLYRSGLPGGWPV